MCMYSSLVATCSVDCLHGSWTCKLTGNWRSFVLVSCARLSWSHSAFSFKSTFNSSIYLSIYLSNISDWSRAWTNSVESVCGRWPAGIFWSADLHATELHQKLTVTDWSIKNLPTFDYSQMMNMGWPQRDGAKLQSLITAVIFTTKSFDPKATGFGVKTQYGLLLNGSTDRVARVSKTRIFQILYPCSTCSTKIGRWTMNSTGGFNGKQELTGI